MLKQCHNREKHGDDRHRSRHDDRSMSERCEDKPTSLQQREWRVGEDR
jgi:hypothetical protein